MNGHEARALQLAGDQYGVITRAQARQRGMTDDEIDYRLTSGRLLSVHRGVYRIAGAPQTARQRAMAACLWLGDGSAVSHVTAAALLRLDGVRRPALHVTVPRSARSGANVDTLFALHSAARLERVDRVVVDGIPCTSAARTLIDVAAALDEERLEVAFESARRMGLVSSEHLARRFTELGGRGKPGSGAIRELLERQVVGDKPLESPLEVKVWRLIRQSDLPLPERQVPILQYRVDMLWLVSRVVLECDGFEAHAGYLRWKRDRRRVGSMEALGYRFVHVTWDDATRRPAEVLDRVRHALA
ncbi:MAG: hypothetical protein QOI55_2958 [Actinomycetota bacterium]|nr:hypothetical protein [Actinomycetota bacterium]